MTVHLLMDATWSFTSIGYSHVAKWWSVVLISARSGDHLNLPVMKRPRNLFSLVVLLAFGSRSVLVCASVAINWRKLFDILSLPTLLPIALKPIFHSGHTLPSVQMHRHVRRNWSKHSSFHRVTIVKPTQSSIASHTNRVTQPCLVCVNIQQVFKHFVFASMDGFSDWSRFVMHFHVLPYTSDLLC